jgi:hypothetical protein
MKVTDMIVLQQSSQRDMHACMIDTELQQDRSYIAGPGLGTKDGEGEPHKQPATCTEKFCRVHGQI